MRLGRVVALACLLFAWSGVHAPAIAETPAPPSSVYVGGMADHLLDETGTLTIDDVASATGQARFRSADGRPANYGARGTLQASLWLRLKIPDVVETYRGDWVLSFREPRTQIATLYVPNGEGWHVHEWFSGQPIPGGATATRYPVFNESAQVLAGRVVYLKIQTRSSMRGSLWLQTDADFIGGYGYENVLFGSLAGLLGALSVYLFSIGIVMRDKAVIGTAGGALAYLVYFLGDQALVETFILPGAQMTSRIMSFGGTFLIYAARLYAEAHYIRFDRHSRLLHGLVVGASLFCLALAALAVISILYDLPFVRRYSASVGIAVLVLGLGAAIVGLFFDPRRATLFLLCWSPAIFGALMRLTHDAAPAIGVHPLAVGSTYILNALSFLAFGIVVSLELQLRERRLLALANDNIERLRAFSEHISDGLWETDTDGRVTFATGPASRRMDLTAGASLEERLGTLTTAESRAAVAAISASLAAGRPFRTEIAIVSGETIAADRHIALSGVPIPGASGAISGYRGVVSDITESVLRRERENQQQKMAAVGQLAGGVAHEINNLLHPIVNLSRRVAKDMPAGDERRRWLDIVADSGVRAATIVSGLLTNVRRPSGEQDRAPVGVALANAVDSLRPIVPPQVAFSLDAGDDPGPLVATNDVFQVMYNLVANAIYATRGAGRIAVRFHPAEGADGPVHVLSVEDNGEGMDARTRNRAMEPFFTTKQPGQGTGLGLPTVYGIVKSWQAAIDIQSRPGRGTRITITIPARAARSEEVLEGRNRHG